MASTLAAVAQNVVGVLVAVPLGQHPLMGVLAGSVTLTGGPATGLAFAPLFSEAGVPGAATLAVAAAMAGIVCGGLIGGPIGTLLIARGKPPENWDRLGIWLALGFAIYFGYGKKHSVMAKLARGEKVS